VDDPRRVAVAVLGAPGWSPPGIDPEAWRLALAEDVLDMLATLAQVEPALAVTDPSLLGRVGWPGLRQYVVPRLDIRSLYEATASDGYDQAVLLVGDAPDLPGMLLAKLLRPLTTRALAAVSVAAPAYYLLRPDGHVGLAGTQLDAAALRGWLSECHMRLGEATRHEVPEGLPT